MGLMEPGCTRRDFGRDVQPAVPNGPRCWSLVGSTFGAISRTGADSTQHFHDYSVFDQAISRSRISKSGWRVGEQSQNPWRKLCVLRKLHPQGGSATRNVSGESLCGSAETIPVPVPCDDDGMFSRASRMEGWTRDETGSHCAVKGDVDAYELRRRRGFPD